MCVIFGFVDFGDMCEVKRILKFMGVDYIMLLDIIGVFDVLMIGKYELYLKGGIKV